MLHTFLTTQLAWGAMSPSMVHQVAVSAITDIETAKAGRELPKLATLAKFKERRSLWRGVQDTLAQESNLPQPCAVNMPYKGDPQRASLLLPHEYFAAMYEDTRAWATSILPDPEKLSEIWESMQNHPAMQNHPMKQENDWKTKCVPLGLHGDEVPIVGVSKIWCRSFLVFSWFSILANSAARGTLDVMIYIWGVFDKFVKEGTMETFWEVMKWSFECLLQGKWPHSDWRGIQYAPTSPEGRKAGRDLAGGYYAALIQIAGDLDYNCKFLGLPRWSAANQCCALCKATKNGILSWMDNRDTAAWIGTIGIGTIGTPSACRLFDLPGMSAPCVAMDYMHCMFLGWLQYLYGSVFYLLVFEIMDGDPLANLQEIWTFTQAHQKRTGCVNKYLQRLNKLSMFKKKTGYPKLKGRACEIKGLDQAMLDVWTKYMQVTNAVHRRIRLLLDLNCALTSILDEYSPSNGFMAVPEAIADEMQGKILSMGRLH
ncbi:unnamed protein product [Polarella glacialis]|uniref:Uncharacterized protein n=1 Tax=Polarella glacialis TaxID=89957 RepID=A0A813JP40_POLGL|nr:unnamed protein product [Polarella glacialis]